MNIGIFYCLATVVLWGLFSVTGNLIIDISINPISLALGYGFFSAITLLILGGGLFKIRYTTLMHPGTWLFAFVSLFGVIASFYLLEYVSGTEGSLMQRATIVFSLVLGWLMFKSKPGKKTGLSLILISAGVLLLVNSYEEKYILGGLLLLAALLETIKSYVIKYYSDFRDDDSMQVRLQSIGTVVFIRSLIFLALMYEVGYVFGVSHIEHTIVAEVVDGLDDWRNPQFWYLSALFAVFVCTPASFCSWNSISLVGPTRFYAFAALTPIVTLFLEWGASFFQEGDYENVMTDEVLVALGLITLGAVMNMMPDKNDDGDDEDIVKS